MSRQKNLPNGMPMDAIERVYIKELARYSNQLIKEIKTFLQQPLAEDITTSSVEIFPDEDGDGYISIGLYLKGEQTTHVAFVDEVKDLPLVDVEYYREEEEESIPDLVVDLIQQWFAECWWKAGGWDFKIPMNVYGHDGFGSGNVIKLTSETN